MVTVLLVDDSDYMRSLLKRILSEAGHCVIGESSRGDNAIAQYEKLKPEIVLLDVVLETGTIAPTGIEALKEIIRTDPRANVVICSGLDEESVINEAMQAGAKAFVPKPLDPEKLLQTIIMCSDLRIIAQMGNLGASRAATVLSRLCGQPIQIELSKLVVGPSNQFAMFNGAPDHQVKAIRMGLHGDRACEALLVFEPNQAAKFGDILTENFDVTMITEKLQSSAIKELGSNVICAFYAAIADFSELSLVPSTPILVNDSLETIVDALLAGQTQYGSSALVFKIKLKKKNGDAEGLFILLTSDEFQRHLIDAGRRLNVVENTPLQLQAQTDLSV